MSNYKYQQHELFEWIKKKTNRLDFKFKNNWDFMKQIHQSNFWGKVKNSLILNALNHHMLLIHLTSRASFIHNCVFVKLFSKTQFMVNMHQSMACCFCLAKFRLFMNIGTSLFI